VVAKAPAAASAAATGDAEALLDTPISGDLAATLFFGSGAAALPEGAAAELDKVKAALAAAPARKVVLSGFHDASGDPAKNAELAKERAKSVREALKAAGIDASRIALRKPEVTTGDGTNQEARRVEIRLVD
jgi:outer membrane protein OmpA-like peptidoglycan-associated protein